MEHSTPLLKASHYLGRTRLQKVKFLWKKGGYFFKPTNTNSVLKRCYLVGGWPTPLKNMSQLGLLFPIYGKNVPNHQPVICLLFWNLYQPWRCRFHSRKLTGIREPKRAWKPGRIPLFHTWENMRKLTFSNGWSPSCATRYIALL